MNRFALFLMTALLVAGCSGQTASKEEAPAPAETAAKPAAEEAVDEAALLEKAEPAGMYGAGLALAAPTPIADLLAAPEALEGKPVQIAGRVAEVCQMRGCWIEVADDASGRSIRVKVDDGVIVFPKSAKDHGIVVEGIVEKLELDAEQTRFMAQHEAEEKGEPFDTTQVFEASVTWRLKGSGAKIAG